MVKTNGMFIMVLNVNRVIMLMPMHQIMDDSVQSDIKVSPIVFTEMFLVKCTEPK